MVVDGHGCQTALHFGVKAKENQDKVLRLYWLPKLYKKTYKARFTANSSSFTTTELSTLLTLCLTAVKHMLPSIVKRGIQFYLLLSPYLCFISLLYLDLYVLGDDALIS